ncbi:xylem serine proteinase 1-like isoform X2 [Hibiscus syriacus]|uniref:Xylem serine proteinase 1-like isoform X2 n=1 Tax=Hibiscus syriacus TaxID=106335 RepID=A0A6A2Y228_HIBSY|nr:xylem serine proteinase 1-like isoform X2 [Hibiscus syriacus]
MAKTHQLLLLLLLVTVSSEEEEKRCILLRAKAPLERDAKDSMVYSYTKSFNAFAAKLSKDEAQMLKELDEVVSVFPNRYHKLHATKSWDFIGFPQTAKRYLKLERDIIVGLLDTGITPQSDSFKDDGFGPPPHKWKGTCHHFRNFSGCNRRQSRPGGHSITGRCGWPRYPHIIHVSWQPTSKRQPLWASQWHSSGAVPSARIATYKVCWVSLGCADMHILTAMDDAISDGVDVISISIGGETKDFVTDSISVSAFHALKKGIVTVASGGNDGPAWAPCPTIPMDSYRGATGTDRQFRSAVKLGNGKSFSGIGINTSGSKETFYPIVSGADVAINAESKDLARFCYDNTLDPAKVKGRLVYCLLVELGSDSVVKAITRKLLDRGPAVVIGSCWNRECWRVLIRAGNQLLLKFLAAAGAEMWMGFC